MVVVIVEGVKVVEGLLVVMVGVAMEVVGEVGVVVVVVGEVVVEVVLVVVGEVGVVVVVLVVGTNAGTAGAPIFGSSC